MNYQTLYRKYRPKSFGYLYGQDTIVKTLKNIIKLNKLSHAYLFTGPRGTGKTSSAKLLAKAINCSNNKDGDACNCCDNCKSFNENSNPDIIEIDAASNNGVDEIREIKNNINLVPSMSKYKIYIIDEVHMLSIGAFNALLKTLEEPPEYIIFILATTEPQKLPATIISRCQRFDFKSISFEKMKECLKNIIEKENINIEDSALDEIILNSNGGMRDAISMLDQSVVFSNNDIKKEDIEALYGTISDEEIIQFFECIKNENYEKIFNITILWEKEGKDFNLIVQKILTVLNKLIINNKVKNVYSDDIILKLTKMFSSDKLYNLFNMINELIKKIQNTYYKKMVFDIEIINIINNLSGNVSRETYIIENNNQYEINKNNVSRETLKKEDNIKEQDELEKLIAELKNIRINNILMNATKLKIKEISESWNKLNEYLLDSKFKFEAGILLKSKIAAASNNGIIITLHNEAEVKRIEQKYDYCKEMISKIYSFNYKLVFINDEYWQKIRNSYVEKVKNKELIELSEKDIIDNIKKIKERTSINDFADLIEVEEK